MDSMTIKDLERRLKTFLEPSINEYMKDTLVDFVLQVFSSYRTIKGDERLVA